MFAAVAVDHVVWEAVHQTETMAFVAQRKPLRCGGDELRYRVELRVKPLSRIEASFGIPPKNLSQRPT